MKNHSRSFLGRLALPGLLSLILLSPAIARADILYEFTSTTSAFSGSAEFTESSILTTVATISTFSSNSFSNLSSLIVAPESGQSCFGGLPPGPCIDAVFTNSPGIENVLFYFPSNLTSIGTYTTNDETGTLQISEQVNAVPEPSALLLLLTGSVLLVGLRATGKRNLADRWLQSPCISESVAESLRRSSARSAKRVPETI